MAVSRRLRYQVFPGAPVDEAGVRWLPIPGTDGMYEASDEGRIRSVDRRVERTDGRFRLLRGRTLKASVDCQTRYLKVVLYRDGRPRHRYVHALVAEAFLGACPANEEVAHGDGNRTNNRVANLRYATRGENQADKVIHGTSNRGTKHPLVVLSEADVWEICRLLDAGWQQR